MSSSASVVLLEVPLVNFIGSLLVLFVFLVLPLWDNLDLVRLLLSALLLVDKAFSHLVDRHSRGLESCVKFINEFLGVDTLLGTLLGFF